ncbi:NTP transferase domain-containing protein [Nocardia terpenica]|uniref:nucleotidyltransferase family protein n=1 Tax=Nocardia terpenica TaxID=455432 RepID=UPI0018952740|nr:NTP transferase domain-containing protein [Nocardia terpenica]MBF6060072.1 NTP transferase domain-containing protein [Nocardia terpenica]MBF6103332.1 NTP transferase domain-containing protein [Nocardia terpenica]MBF6112294.1 NTP transferase domain-containing protein [Nocardia terpenica]MBF6117553.1 NTP transferase domain-containing protein [Nocardia terpenica]MBF6157300.1 NTP transferase domain-containing protein [Nocardia terpenica]
MDDGRCDGIVLAAGAGTRYGRPKVLAADGVWLRTAVAALRDGGCARVFLVLGATGPARRDADGRWLVCESPAIAVPEGVQPVWAPDWAVGVAASLRAGLGAVAEAAAAEPDPARYAAIMPVDTPDVGADVVARVLAAARASRSGLARAVFHGGPGHPVVLLHEHWPAVIKSAQGNSGARSFLDARPDIVAVTCDDLATGRDHDYPPTRAR